jgi:hypothetical protein
MEKKEWIAKKKRENYRRNAETDREAVKIKIQMPKKERIVGLEYEENNK